MEGNVAIPAMFYLYKAHCIPVGLLKNSGKQCASVGKIVLISETLCTDYINNILKETKKNIGRRVMHTSVIITFKLLKPDQAGLNTARNKFNTI